MVPEGPSSKVCLGGMVPFAPPVYFKLKGRLCYRQSLFITCQHLMVRLQMLCSSSKNFRKKERTINRRSFSTGIGSGQFHVKATLLGLCQYPRNDL